LLFNLREARWDDRLLEIFRVPRACLPEVLDSCLSRADAIEIELDGIKLPLAGIAGDQQAALYGQACLDPGLGKNTYGTGSFVLVNAGTEPPPAPEGLLTTVAWALIRRDPTGARAASSGISVPASSNSSSGR